MAHVDPWPGPWGPMGSMGPGPLLGGRGIFSRDRPRPAGVHLAFCATQKHNVSGQKLLENQKLQETGRRATALRFPGMEKHPTGLPEPLGLFRAPKTGNKKKCWAPWGALGPLLGAALKGMLHWFHPEVSAELRKLDTAFQSLRDKALQAQPV